MKQYRKTWFMSFVISGLVLISLILAFLQFSGVESRAENQKPQEQTESAEEPPPEFTDYDDNVGAVTFTEEQITELARNIFSLDSLLSNVRVKLSEGGQVSVSAKIRDKDKLTTQYPQLSSFAPVLAVIENKNISVDAVVEDDNGTARLSISGVTVAGMPIDKSVLKPFIEEEDFSELFKTEYDNVTVTDGKIIFKNGVPDILQY